MPTTLFNHIKTTKTITNMKNFFSQTWVVALLVAVVLGVVCYIAFKKKGESTTTTTPATEETTK